MSCEPERVTGFVDGALDPAAAAAVAGHLEACPDCRAQAQAERELRGRLAALPAPELPAGLEERVRQAGRSRPRALPAAARWALPFAALVLGAAWLRGYAPFVAWDVVRDHDKCFARQPLPAELWSDEPRVVGEWFDERGTHLPALPAAVGKLALVGARYCPLASLSSAPHVYYASPQGRVSAFVIPHAVRVADRLALRTRGRSVRLLRLEGELVAIVAEQEAEAQAFETALRPLLAARAAAAR